MGTPRTVRASSTSRSIDANTKKKQEIKVVHDKMSKKWAFIDNVDAWFNECLQGQSVPPTILDAVCGEFSRVLYNANGTLAAAYYPILVCGVICIWCSLILNLLIVRYPQLYAFPFR